LGDCFSLNFDDNLRLLSYDLSGHSSTSFNGNPSSLSYDLSGRFWSNFEDNVRSLSYDLSGRFSSNFDGILRLLTCDLSGHSSTSFDGKLRWLLFDSFWKWAAALLIACDGWIFSFDSLGLVLVILVDECWGYGSFWDVKFEWPWWFWRQLVYWIIINMGTHFFIMLLTSCKWRWCAEHNCWQYSHGICSVMGCWLIILEVFEWRYIW
jgi:hypothetical protein